MTEYFHISLNLLHIYRADKVKESVSHLAEFGKKIEVTGDSYMDDNGLKDRLTGRDWCKEQIDRDVTDARNRLTGRD